jgi:hypothetical protein
MQVGFVARFRGAEIVAIGRLTGCVNVISCGGTGKQEACTAGSSQKGRAAGHTKEGGTMVVPRKGSPRRSWGRRALMAQIAVGGLMTGLVGCQAQHAGMTLPSGKYMFDDVQYFPPGPATPMANTQAATQRARMRAMGIDPGSSMPTGPIGAPPNALGAPDPTQNIPNRPTNLNVLEPETPLEPNGNAVPPGVPAPPPPGDVPVPDEMQGDPAGGGDFGPR